MSQATVRPVHQAPKQDTTRGLLLLAAASVSFALMGTITHAVKLSFWELSLARGVVISLILLPTIIRQRLPITGRDHRWLFIRSFAGSASLFAYFFSLQKLTLADASLLTFSSPIWIALFAPWVLQEVVRVERLVAISVGFVGLLLVLGPSGEWLSLGGLAGVFSGACAGLAYMAVRKLRQDHPLIVVFQFSLTSIVLALPGAIWYGRWPVGLEWLSMLGIGSFAALGQYLMTLGYQRVEASAGSTMTLLNPLLSQLISVLFFAEPIGPYQIAGVVLVLGAGVYLSRVETSRK